jgi:hypothetical protein
MAVAKLPFFSPEPSLAVLQAPATEMWEPGSYLVEIGSGSYEFRVQ